MVRRLSRIGLACGVVALLLTSCQQTKPGGVAPSSEPSESKRPALEEPQLPNKARKGNYAGAIAFVEHYYELADYGDKTGDWEALKESSAPQCDACKQFWNPDPPRALDYDDFSSNDPSLNDLVDGVAKVNVTIDDKKRTRKGSKFNLTWVDSVRCIFDKGRWQVISIKSETY